MKKYKSEFPIFKRTIHGKPLTYLDSAATSQLPLQVFEAVKEFEFNHRANVHRGIHTLSEEASEMYEAVRKKIKDFISAVVPEEIVFVRNSTEALNLIAYSWAQNNLQKDDIILVTEAEHHSNFVQWQEFAKKHECRMDIIPITKDGKISIENAKTDWTKVKLVAFHHVSNVLGVINDPKEITKEIKKRVIAAKKLSSQEANIKRNFPKIVIDVSQSIPHISVNVQKFGADFVAFSGHKMYGPMGIGVLWINREIFGELKPFLFGGGMISEVFIDNTNYTEMPEMLEAGTPNVSGAIGLAAACDFITEITYEEIKSHEQEIMTYAFEKLLADNEIEIYGTSMTDQKCSVISFNVKGIPSHDLATVLDSEGVAIRSGQHCVMPWHLKTGIQTSARISFGIYSEKEDIDRLMIGIAKAREIIISK